LAIQCRVIVAVFDCLRQIEGTRRRRRLYQLRRRQTPLSSVTLHSGIVSVLVQNDVLGLTLVAAKVLLDKIH